MLSDLDRLKARALDSHKGKEAEREEEEKKRQVAEKEGNQAFVDALQIRKEQNVNVGVGIASSIREREIDLWSRAIECWERSRNNPHGVACALHRRAEVHVMMGRLDEALKDMARAVVILPNFMYVDMLHKQILVRKGLGDTQKCKVLSARINQMASMFKNYAARAITSSGRIPIRPSNFLVEKKNAAARAKKLAESLPDDLGKASNFAVLTYHHPPAAPMSPTHIFVIGTNHVSKSSAESVKKLIKHLRPSCVFVELCDGRSHMLDPRALDQLKKQRSFGELLGLWRERKISTFEMLHGYFLSSVGSKLKTIPGEEFRMAKQASEEVGATLCLGDRPVSITIKRAWNSLSRWQKVKLVFEYLWGSIRGISEEELEKLDECMKTRGVLELLKEEFAGSFPEMLHTLCTERDMYMAYQLRLRAGMHPLIVAVVGAAHVPGIRYHWDDTDIDMHEISSPIVRRHNRRAGQSYALLKCVLGFGVFCAGAWGVLHVARTRGPAIRGRLRGWRIAAGFA
eukprot:g2647.t1